MAANRPTLRAVGGPLAAVAFLIGLSVMRFAFPDAQGLMLFAIVPIALLGMMRGFAAGLLAGGYASAATLLWAFTSGNAYPAQYAGEPLTFFILGGLSGWFAKGALGDFDLEHARTCSQLRHAMSSDQLGLYYQPIVRPTGEVLAVEALSRWHDPERGLIEPLQFIPAAESDPRTIGELTLHVLRRAVRDARDFGDHLVVAVNLSPVNLLHRALPREIHQILEGGGLPPSRLAVEVTESAIPSGDESPLIDVLWEIREVGVSMVALDDFGIGHSSISRLGRLPIDTVKIDRTLIADGASTDTAAVIRGMIRLGHALDLTVIAEGVEDAKTWDWLVSAECDAMQGFRLSRPMPPDELIGWLEDHRLASQP